MLRVVMPEPVAIGPVNRPMTVGELARRTGLSVKALREYEGLGLIYTLGRSEGNYRLFDESALWCVAQIRRARSFGLTIKEIRELCQTIVRGPDGAVGPRLRALLDRALARAETQIAALQDTRGRILEAQRRLERDTAHPAQAIFEPEPTHHCTVSDDARLGA